MKLAPTAFILAPVQQADETVVKEVLNYFIHNPQAADNLEGVARWRLLDEVVRRKVEETQRALEWLVKQGFLDKRTVAGREAVFSLNHEKLTEAQAFVSTPGLPSKRTKS